ncbi:28551_t:CDS:1, partial [Racocetra persica]
MASALREKLKQFENLNSQNNRPLPPLPNKFPKSTRNSNQNKINEDKDDKNDKAEPAFKKINKVAARLKAFENDKNTVSESILSKIKPIKRTVNKTIDTSLTSLPSNNEKSMNQQSSPIRSPVSQSSIRSPVSIESDLLKYKGHHRDDSFSKSTSDYQSEASQLRLSDNEHSVASTGMTSPIESSSMEKEELEILKKEYETMRLRQSQETDTKIHQLKNELERLKFDHKMELEKVRKELKDQEIQNEERLRNQQDEQINKIIRDNDIEKNKLMKELESIKILKDEAENNLIENKQYSNQEKLLLSQEHEREMEKLKDDHSNQIKIYLSV